MVKLALLLVFCVGCSTRPMGVGAPVGAPVSIESLDEVNRERAKRGKKPYIKDELLTQGAMRAASYRAEKLMAGHTRNDFDYLPAGASAKAAGCGALADSWGWGTCCTFDNYTAAGAAWARGRDGRRYMHLFCR